MSLRAHIIGLMASAAGGVADTYAVLGNSPPVVADFESATEVYRVGWAVTDFATMFDSSRASSAAYFNSSGILTTASSGVARLSHHLWSGSAWVKQGILLETARTNLIVHSNDFTQWSNAQSTDTAAAGTGPDGNSSMTKLAANATTTRLVDIEIGGSIHDISYSSANAQWIFYAVMEADEVGHGMLIVSPSTNNWVNATFNLSTGAVSQTSGGATSGTVHDADVIDLSNGLYLCWMIFSLNTTDINCPFYIGASNTGTPSLNTRGRLPYSATFGEGILIGFSHVGVGPTPSSYIATAGATVTRAADALSIAAADMEYNASDMWFSLSGTETYADLATAGQVTLFDWRVDANNRITVTIDTDGAETGEITLTMVSGGSAWSVAADYLSPGTDVPFSIAWRVADDEINLAVGGAAATANTSPTSIPDLSAADATFGGMGARALFRQGIGAIGDAGIEAAS